MACLPRPQVGSIEGDLLDQDVDAIVNPWNRNIIPWWLLLPQGVSGAIKRRAGFAPFRELGRHGPLPLGGAVLTGAGRLPFRAIIHVAGISMWWRSSPHSIRLSCQNAMALASTHGFRSVALPWIGAGTGGMEPNTVRDVMVAALEACAFEGTIRLVRFLPMAQTKAQLQTKAQRPTRRT